MDIQARNEAIGFCKKYIDEHGGGGGETSSEIATIVNKLGAKNLLINVGANSKTNAGVTFTKNADETVSATRVSSADSTATYNIVDSANLNTDHYANLGEVILSGTPADGSANICVMLRQTSGTGHIYYNGVEVVDLDGTGALVDLDHCTLDAAGETPIGRDDMRIIVRVAKTEEPNNVVFKPMLRYKGIEDGTYVPYVKTNAEATKDLQRLIQLGNPTTLQYFHSWGSFPDYDFFVAGIEKRASDYSTGQPLEVTFTDNNKVENKALQLGYTFAVDTQPEHAVDIYYSVKFDTNLLLLLNPYVNDYIKFTLVKTSDGYSKTLLHLKYFNGDVIVVNNKDMYDENATITIGLKLKGMTMLTGFALTLMDHYYLEEGTLSKSDTLKLTDIEYVNETAYNACNYKF